MKIVETHVKTPGVRVNQRQGNVLIIFGPRWRGIPSRGKSFRPLASGESLLVASVSFRHHQRVSLVRLNMTHKSHLFAIMGQPRRTVLGIYLDGRSTPSQHGDSENFAGVVVSGG